MLCLNFRNTEKLIRTLNVYTYDTYIFIFNLCRLFFIKKLGKLGSYQTNLIRSTLCMSTVYIINKEINNSANIKLVAFIAQNLSVFSFCL